MTAGNSLIWNRMGVSSCLTMTARWRKQAKRALLRRNKPHLKRQRPGVKLKKSDQITDNRLKIAA
jgi:hypothetical protein